MNSWPYVADRPTRNGEPEAASPAPAGPKEAAAATVSPTTASFEARDHHDRRDHHDPTEAIPGGAMRAGVAAAMPALDTDDEASALAPPPAESPSPGGRTGGRTAGSVPQADGGFTRALPVIAVGVIVAVLAVGVAWVVMFGEDPAEQRQPASTTSAAPPSDNLSNGAGQLRA